MDDLAAWLTEVWDEQEKAAANGSEWACLTIPAYSDESARGEVDLGDTIIAVPTPEIAWHIAANDPASVLARIAADRQILALHTGPHECPYWDGNGEFWEDLYCPTTLLLAKAHADRPGYQEAWRP